jgi:site-specific recombinase XerD
MKKVSFIVFPKKDKLNQITNECPLYGRITVAGKRVTFSLNRKINFTTWQETHGLRKVRKEVFKELNTFIDAIKFQIHKIERSLIEDDIPITAQKIKDILLGRNVDLKDQETLINYFEKHNREFEIYVKSGTNAAGSLQRYNTVLSHIKSFMKKKYSIDDILLKELRYEFVHAFDLYLRSDRKCNNNSAVKYVRNLRKVINMAVRDELISKDPFVKYPGKIKQVNRQYLTIDEILKIKEKDFKIQRLEIVRDIFLFAILTGYGYSEVSKLKHDNIITRIDGEKWIETTRTKTHIPQNALLFPVVLKLIDKYKNHPFCIENNLLFPIPSNQKVNSYLKEIADCSEVTKNLTFHMARHTYATTILLSNGASMETAMAALGHNNIRQTQHYGKITNKTVSDDLQKVRANLMAYL